MFGTLASAAGAAAPAITVRTDYPDTAVGGVHDSGLLGQHGQWIKMGVYVENSGNGAMSGPLTISLTVPAGTTVKELRGEGAEENSCEINGLVATCTVDGARMLPAAQEQMRAVVELDPAATGTLTSSIEVSGGGVAETFTRQEDVVIGPPDPFEIETFTAGILDETNGDERQAGTSPGRIGTEFAVPTFATEDYEFPFGNFLSNAVSEHVRNVIVHAPAGMVANFAAIPQRCTAAQLGTENRNPPRRTNCPDGSQVGVANVLGNYTSAVYAMQPPPGVAAEFGFVVVGVPVLIDAHIRPSDYGVDLVSRNTSSSIPIGQFGVTLWGVPADPQHDPARVPCLGDNGHNGPPATCPTDDPRKAFLRLPTSCSGPLGWSTEMDTYEQPGAYLSRALETPAQVGCNQLDFTPSVQARPTTDAGDSPTGLEVKVHVPQNEDPEGLAEAHVKALSLKFPTGLAVNSASADGLGACSPEQIGLVSPVGQLPAHFNGDHAACPESSKIGSAVVVSPALDHPLPGKVYVASQNQNPFGSLLALYLVIDDPQSGVVVKTPVRGELDPHTGQLTAAVNDNPQLPFEDLTIELDKGPHAPLRTPLACGRYTSASHVVPWSEPEGKAVDLTDSFQIVNGAGGRSCVDSEGAAPGVPAFEAGTLEPKAGAYSPFVLKLSRNDGTQQLTGIRATLPEGLLARLAGTAYCPESTLAAAAAKSGRAEQAAPSCPANSQVGTVNIAAGAGPAPLHVQGKAYLTGPYKGAPIGLAVVTPAVAGPFDLGTVVVRNALRINPVTAQAEAVSDPIPHILQGVPLDLRQVRIDVDRSKFTVNPTSCDPMSIAASAALLSGQNAALSSPFQVGGCGGLGFKPHLSLRLKGKPNRTAHPALRAELTTGSSSGANIAHAVVALPHSEFLDQAHIRTICTRVQFAEGAGGGVNCPKASIYGFARALTPLLDKPLEGPVFLRSSSHELPDLVVSLDGQIHVDVSARIDSTKAGGIRTTFESVPDAPISKFVLMMQGGKKGLLQNSTNICRGKHRVDARFEAHNGKVLAAKPALKATCKKKAGKKRQHRRHGR